jgi:hypothetical protein
MENPYDTNIMAVQNGSVASGAGGPPEVLGLDDLVHARLDVEVVEDGDDEEVDADVDLERGRAHASLSSAHAVAGGHLPHALKDKSDHGTRRSESSSFSGGTEKKKNDAKYMKPNVSPTPASVRSVSTCRAMRSELST